MSGLETLVAEGLQLLPDDVPEFVERLTWLPVPANLPDDGITVLAWIVDADGNGAWFSARWDSQQSEWIDAASGGPIGGTVTHFSEPEGPMP